MCPLKSPQILAALALGVAAASAFGQCDPTLLGSVYTGGDNLKIAVAGDVAYVNDRIGGTHVIDASNPALPVKVTTLTQAAGTAVDVADGMLYSASYPTLYVFDASNPLNPVQVGSLSAPATIADLFADGDYVYMALEGTGVWVVDVSDPANPTMVASVGSSAPGCSGPACWLGTRGVTVAGDYLYMADSSELRVVDVSDPTSPVIVGSTPMTFATEITVSGNVVYVVEQQFAAITTVDVSDPTNPTVLTTVHPSTFGWSTVEGVQVAGTFAYVGGAMPGNANAFLATMDVSDPLNPTLIDYLDVGGNSSFNLALSGSTVYLLNRNFGLHVIDVASCVVADQPPTAVAGDDQSIRAGDTVDLDGGASFDDNTASEDLAYSWSFFSKPGGSAATLTGANTDMPSFIADVAGTYVIDLVVTDDAGASSEIDQVEISSDNLAPTAVATVDFSLAIIGQEVNFDGSASTDPEDDALTYAWTITAAPAGSTAALVGAHTATPSLSADLEGDYEVTLTVSDFLGAGTPATVDITATTASDYAEIQIIAACDLVEGLSASQVKTKGNQRALCNFLRQAIRQLQNGHVDGALDKLGKALDRTDGCAWTGAPDGNGPGMDWITDCDAQADVYWLITDAMAALEP